MIRAARETPFHPWSVGIWNKFQIQMFGVYKLTYPDEPIFYTRLDWLPSFHPRFILQILCNRCTY